MIPRWVPAFSSTLLSLQELLEEQRLHDLELQQLREEQAAQAAQAREEGSTDHRFQAWEKQFFQGVVANRFVVPTLVKPCGTCGDHSRCSA